MVSWRVAGRQAGLRLLVAACALSELQCGAGRIDFDAVPTTDLLSTDAGTQKHSKKPTPLTARSASIFVLLYDPLIEADALENRNFFCVRALSCLCRPAISRGAAFIHLGPAASTAPRHAPHSMMVATEERRSTQTPATTRPRQGQRLPAMVFYGTKGDSVAACCTYG